MTDKLIKEFVTVTDILIQYGKFSVAEAQNRFFVEKRITDDAAKRRLRGEYLRLKQRKVAEKRVKETPSVVRSETILTHRVILGAYAKDRHDKKTLVDTDIS